VAQSEGEAAMDRIAYDRLFEELNGPRPEEQDVFEKKGDSA
jgi:hypothetical protein